MRADELKRLIEQGLPGSRVIVRGEDGVHFEAVVISENFAGKSLVQQHRMVNAVLRNRIESQELHALSLKTYTPEAWSKVNPEHSA